MTVTASLEFELPPGLEAGEPPEERGLARDGVRLLVATPDGICHRQFRDLDRFLEPGDLLVVNTSATLPAAVEAARASGERVVVHFSSRLDEGSWVVEARGGPSATCPLPDATAGEVLEMPGRARLRLLAGHPDQDVRTGSRLWAALLTSTDDFDRWINDVGRPIRYAYVGREWPLSAYQTVFATHAGSSEMPSAGRPFSTELVTRLVSRGVYLAPVVLHTGVSSLEAGEGPQPEWFSVPEPTARLVELTRRNAGRVVAVGTTATRAIESAVTRDGTVAASHGWTDLVLGPNLPARVVDGLVTGWHAPGASHLALLEAVAGPAMVAGAYRAALAEGYRWHEFGDSCLLLPPARGHRPAAGRPRSR